jgi:hypothetical protein
LFPRRLRKLGPQGSEPGAFFVPPKSATGSNTLLLKIACLCGHVGLANAEALPRSVFTRNAAPVAASRRALLGGAGTSGRNRVSAVVRVPGAAVYLPSGSKPLFLFGDAFLRGIKRHPAFLNVLGVSRIRLFGHRWKWRFQAESALEIRNH